MSLVIEECATVGRTVNPQVSAFAVFSTVLVYFSFEGSIGKIDRNNFVGLAGPRKECQNAENYDGDRLKHKIIQNCNYDSGKRGNDTQSDS